MGSVHQKHHCKSNSLIREADRSVGHQTSVCVGLHPMILLAWDDDDHDGWWVMKLFPPTIQSFTFISGLVTVDHVGNMMLMLILILIYFRFLLSYRIYDQNVWRPTSSSPFEAKLPPAMPRVDFWWCGWPKTNDSKPSGMLSDRIISPKMDRIISNLYDTTLQHKLQPKYIKHLSWTSAPRFLLFFFHASDPWHFGPMEVHRVLEFLGMACHGNFQAEHCGQDQRGGGGVVLRQQEVREAQLRDSTLKNRIRKSHKF